MGAEEKEGPEEEKPPLLMFQPIFFFAKSAEEVPPSMPMFLFAQAALIVQLWIWIPPAFPQADKAYSASSRELKPTKPCNSSGGLLRCGGGSTFAKQ